MKIAITRQISKYNHSSSNNIQYIVIHDTGNHKDKASSNANYFCECDRKSSAHYFVDDNSIYQVVEDYHGAWHVGDGRGKYGITNRNSLGIEMCNSGGYTSEKTIQNTVELVRFLMKKYSVSIDRVVRHYDASRKTCPNNMSANNWAKWHEFKNRLNTNISANFKTPKKTYSVGYCLEWQRFYNGITQTKAPISEDGLYGRNTQSSLDSLLGYIKQSKKYKYCLEFQRFYNRVTKTKAPIIEDGYWGRNTEKAFNIISRLVRGEY